jgi:hypothetical protein
MGTKKMLSCWSAALLIAGTAGQTHAAECSGYDILVGQAADTVDVGNGHTMTVIRAWSVLITDDPKSVYNLTTGECQGTILATPDGKAQAAGYCARRDKEKDTQSIQWTQAPARKRANGTQPVVPESLPVEPTQAGSKVSLPTEKCRSRDGAESADSLLITRVAQYRQA